MELDALLLARLQFAFTIGFHILFPALTIGLALFLVLLEGLWLRTRQLAYLRHYHFWSKLFALSFGMGVVSGIVLSYEIGTNFSGFSRITGNTLGPLFSYEVLTAFFLEAGFLGIMLFGWKRVSPTMHYAATILVALGTALSAFWILSANSWMQTPAGYRFDGHVFHVADWWQIIFNPSFPYRFVHMLGAAYLSSSLVIGGISAWYLLKGRQLEFARRSFRMAVIAIVVLAPLQIFSGDQHGLNTLEHQPIKVAAMEAHWESGTKVPFFIFALPDIETESNRMELAIPYGASLILKHDPDGYLQGLKSVPKEDRPYVPLVFFSFRVMLAIGFFLLAMAVVGAYLWRKGVLYERRWYLRTWVGATPLGFIALLAGWTVTEAGRQPWVVYGLVRTAEAVSDISAPRVASSLLAFFVVYLIIFSGFLHFVLRTIRKGPASARDLPGLTGQGGMQSTRPRGKAQ